MLLSLPIPDYIQYAEVEGYDGLFYTLTLLRKSRSFPAAFLLEDGQTVSPGSIMTEFRQHLDQFIKVFYSGECPRAGATWIPPSTLTCDISCSSRPESFLK